MRKLTDASLERPITCLVMLALVTALLGAALPGLRTEYGYRVLIGENHPATIELDGFVARFRGGLPSYIVWECGNGLPCQSVFDPVSLRMAHALTTLLASSSGIARVEGPSNAPLLLPERDGFAIRRFVENDRVVPDLDALAERAVQDSLWVDQFVSSDGRVGVIVIQPWEFTNAAQEGLVDLLEGAVTNYVEAGHEFHLLGAAVASVVPGRALAASTAGLVPVTVAVIGALVVLLARSWLQALLVVGSLCVALVWTYGLLAWLDWPQDGILEVLAPLVLVVGVCDAIHLLSGYANQISSLPAPRSLERRERSMSRAAEETAPPCAITTATTALALLSFTASPLGTFQRFGVIASVGVCACLILTFTLVPILAVRIPFGTRGETPNHAGSSSLSALVVRLVREIERWPGVIILVSVSVLALSGIGVYRLRVDTSWLETWGVESPVSQAVLFVEERLGRSTALEVEIGLPEDVELVSPGTIERIEHFKRFLEGTAELGRVTSVLDLMSRLNRLLHDDDPELERTLESSRGNAELIELLALDDPLMLEGWLSLDRSHVRMSVEASEVPYSVGAGMLSAIEDYVKSSLPSDWDVRLTGQFAMDVSWVRDVQATQLRSFPIAFCLVFVLVACFLRSVRLAAAAMIPTLFPVVVCLGVMGWSGMSLDVGRSMVAAVMMGIAVDDSIHLLSRYMRRRRLGDSRSEAIRESVIYNGPAVITTSLALSLGFLTLLGSAWQTISSFGLVVAIAIITALVTSLCLLPALIFVHSPSVPGSLHTGARSGWMW